MSIPNWKNRTLFLGENLEFLKKMNSNTVDLIATDPPFKRGKDFHSSPTSLDKSSKFGARWRWDKDVYPDWLEKLEDDFPKVLHIIQGVKDSFGNDMAAYLCYMGMRMVELERILKPDGSIYLHCDPTASHYLKALMDAIFGKAKFRNHITWRRTKAKNQSQLKHFGKISDHILFYGKPINSDSVKIPLDEEYVKKNFRHSDDRGEYRIVTLTMQGTRKGESGRPWKGYDPNELGRHWIVPKTGNQAEFIESQIPGYKKISSIHKRLKILEKNDFITWSKNGIPGLKSHNWEGRGTIPGDIWTDIENVHASASEYLGYPTQKPLELYKRIIEASSNEGDVVFDPFCGGSTTLLAAELLGRQWVGIDYWEDADNVLLNRLVGENLLNADFSDYFKYEKFSSKTIKGFKFTKNEPKRSDDGMEAGPKPKKPSVVFLPEPGPVDRKPVMKQKLIKELGGLICQGCNRKFDHESYLEIDHKNPRSLGGCNHISNRTLLCRPCNNRKSNILTMEGLIRENKRIGFLIKAK